ncbi:MULTISPECIES: VOC family protein [unclassified Methylobacterium]|jgi:catechol 2,3-dioxygenase-like lactoylglutathione lyase family enzyme|uniref:VOC family protein n=1 Tax=unclassified Methylobacterium TaxID=2615210 RepID=UPI000700F3F4|nr:MULTISPECIES: VOC family protein [unclassified Methylobacterium]KQO55808.1 glyoxalase [Methylobacterium sp. Leaf87]KQP58330.1 glyoxalase [Methylobacterium sp. Leaf112]USU34181.1 VOC family protein [Methylobacterium sp. OTU13CASTA1]
MDPRLTLVTLGVADLARAVNFYEALGWTRSAYASEGVAFFQLGGLVLSLYPRAALAEDAGVPPDGSGFRGFALAHNTASRDDADAVLAHAVRAGARLVKPAQDTFWGGYSGYFADPDGALWEVAWNPGLLPLADGTVRLPP